MNYIFKICFVLAAHFYLLSSRGTEKPFPTSLHAQHVFTNFLSRFGHLERAVSVPARFPQGEHGQQGPGSGELAQTGRQFCVQIIQDHTQITGKKVFKNY